MNNKKLRKTYKSTYFVVVYLKDGVLKYAIPNPFRHPDCEATVVLSKAKRFETKKEAHSHCKKDNINHYEIKTVEIKLKLIN